MVPNAGHRLCSWHPLEMLLASLCILIFKPRHCTEHSVLAVVPREKLIKNINHIPGCCFLSIYRPHFYCISSYLKLILLFSYQVQTYKGACSLKVHNYSHSVCLYCYRMLCFGALSSADPRSSVEIHCLEHSLIRMLAGDLVSDVASSLFSVYKIESYHTGLSGPPCGCSTVL